jgi:hypothetical protein
MGKHKSGKYASLVALGHKASTFIEFDFSHRYNGGKENPTS